jgi:hypothetical protein
MHTTKIPKSNKYGMEDNDKKAAVINEILNFLIYQEM